MPWHVSDGPTPPPAEAAPDRPKLRERCSGSRAAVPLRARPKLAALRTGAVPAAPPSGGATRRPKLLERWAEMVPLAGGRLAGGPRVDLGGMAMSRLTLGWNVQCSSSSTSSRERRSVTRSPQERSPRDRCGELCRPQVAWPKSVSAGRKVHSASSAAAAVLSRSTRRCEEGSPGTGWED